MHIRVECAQGRLQTNMFRRLIHKKFDKPSAQCNNNVKCFACGGAIIASESHILIPPSRVTGDERRYHDSCFKCYICNLPIDPKSQTLCFSCVGKKNSNNSKGNQYPFHKPCYDYSSVWKCVVCEQMLPSITTKNGITAFKYLKHPFFDEEVSRQVVSRLSLSNLIS